MFGTCSWAHNAAIPMLTQIFSGHLVARRKMVAEAERHMLTWSAAALLCHGAKLGMTTDERKGLCLSRWSLSLLATCVMTVPRDPQMRKTLVLPRKQSHSGGSLRSRGTLKSQTRYEWVMAGGGRRDSRKGAHHVMVLRSSRNATTLSRFPRRSPKSHSPKNSPCSCLLRPQEHSGMRL